MTRPVWDRALRRAIAGGLRDAWPQADGGDDIDVVIEAKVLAAVANTRAEIFELLQEIIEASLLTGKDREQRLRELLGSLENRSEMPPAEERPPSNAA